MKVSELQVKIQKAITVPDINGPLFANVGDEYKKHFENKDIYFNWLTASIKVWKPKKIVELGAAAGSSTLALYLKKLKDTKLISIDYATEWGFLPAKMKKDKNVTLIMENSLNEEMIKKHKKLLMGIDYLFVDTVHNFDQLTAEIKLYEPFLADTCLVVLDDIMVGDMYEYWKIIDYPKLEIPQYHSSGFGFFIYKKGK